MGRRLASFVHVQQEDGTYKVYGPDDDVPADDAEKITNPKAWGSEPEEKPKRRTRASK